VGPRAGLDAETRGKIPCLCIRPGIVLHVVSQLESSEKKLGYEVMEETKKRFVLLRFMTVMRDNEFPLVLGTNSKRREGYFFLFSATLHLRS
jgi:hypothetical protein